MGHGSHQFTHGDEFVLLDQVGQVMLEGLDPALHLGFELGGDIPEDLQDLDDFPFSVKQGIGRDITEVVIAFGVGVFVKGIGRFAAG